tara:strand:- start:36 stop:761 length:726 start_codon:yes stop_codon:yes gene_type:complete
MNGGMLVFHNGSNTSYANHSRNLTSMSSATTAITLRFLGQGASATATSTDAVVLTITAGKEEEVMEFLAQNMAAPRRGMLVVADDQNSLYSHDNITAVDSISVDNGAGTFRNLIPATFTTADTGGVDNAMIFTNADSGSEVVCTSTTDAASIITLPAAPIDGFNLRFSGKVTSGAHTITIAGAFYGQTTQGGGAVEHALGSTSAVIAANDFDLGDHFTVVYTGAAYHISGNFDVASALAVS